ncbi:biogenesis of lysosome-related organelles complex 1 subunit 4-like [Stegodyphus dumicola]|uniref:biogenesis of lysosome-related organelles complex 1 subunit 4-like n=1 Tax=Stegodyphus dumicola TaxID=202533 RepID=UPI0015AEE240|nr:biogenesis of lysosome-related organelles complex 1 subunit 4-like [Stegodyphus dumicola]
MADDELSPTEERPIVDEKSPDKAKLDNLITNLAHDYSKYLKVDVTAEKAVLEDAIEDVLTRLDEFTSLVDMVRDDSTLCLNSTLPAIHKKYEEMEKIFQRIDRLEEMVNAIKHNLDVMEEKVTEAEEQLDTSSVKKLFNSLQKPLFSKKSGD